jgi:hypothetical protein
MSIFSLNEVDESGQGEEKHHADFSECIAERIIIGNLLYIQMNLILWNQTYDRSRSCRPRDAWHGNGHQG